MAECIYRTSAKFAILRPWYAFESFLLKNRRTTTQVPKTVHFVALLQKQIEPHRTYLPVQHARLYHVR